MNAFIVLHYSSLPLFSLNVAALAQPVPSSFVLWAFVFYLFFAGFMLAGAKDGLETQV